MNRKEFEKALEDIVQISDCSKNVITYGFEIMNLKLKFQQLEVLKRIANSLEQANRLTELNNVQ